ncbi:MAG: hypothetical protein ISS35_02755 [Kiritimatiellae bacterium]|nr:hypothetical protein [Kiritimatiellia bacterium]
MQTSKACKIGYTLLASGAFLLAMISTGLGAETAKTLNSKNSLTRDPFWPVGYVPRVVQQAIESQQQAAQQQVQAKALVQWPSLSLTGITKTGDRNIGLIGGVGLVEAGDVVRMSRDGVIYKWVITEITKQGLSYKRISAKPVPLKKIEPSEATRQQ